MKKTIIVKLEAAEGKYLANEDRSIVSRVLCTEGLDEKDFVELSEEEAAPYLNIEPLKLPR